MKRTGIWAIWMVAGLVTSASADGLIVPVRPDVRVSGAWAVEYHYVDIRVRDQVASVAIDQKFVNLGSGMIEVEYFFPVPPEAAIDSMTLVVDGKEFAAKLLPADEARRIYEDIVRRKKDPALLEYAGFGLLRSRAFPLEPGKPARVQVTYKQVCRKDGDAVEVWYPLNTEKFSARKINDVKVVVDIQAGGDLAAVYSPTHDLDVKRKAPDHVIATYHEKDTLPTTDIQVFYKTAKQDVGATFLTYQPHAGEDGYFLLLVSPNPRTAATKALPKDVVVVFDHSGSMAGEKLRQTKDAVEHVLKNLNADDRFNVVAYSDLIEPFFQHLMPATEANVKSTLQSLDRIDASGGTNIAEALQTAIDGNWPRGKDVPADHPLVTRPKYVIFLTDGLPTVGQTDVPAILKTAKDYNQWGARVFAFGVGYDVNVPLLDKLAAENRGRSEYVKPNEPVDTKITALYNKIRNPVMTDLKLEIQGARLRDMYPRQLGDLFEGDQIVLVGRYDPAGSAGGRPQVVLTGSYLGKSRGFEYPVELAPAGERRGYEFIEKLWAIRRVGYLMDQVQLNGQTKEVIDEIVRLSQRYGIMTPYTSFLADESTPLARPEVIHSKAGAAFYDLERASTGAAAQRGAAMREDLKQAAVVAQPTAPGVAADMIGNTNDKPYEGGQKETVANVRQAGNQALYRRGQVWVAANASQLDPKRDQAKIRVVERFSPEYFKLVQDNTVEENQILSAQQEGEELLITLRGQAYQIR